MATMTNFCLYNTRLIPASGGFIDLTSGEGPPGYSHHGYEGIVVGTHMKGGDHTERQEARETEVPVPIVQLSHEN